MEGDSRLPWIIVGVLLVCAAICALTETAISSVSKSRVKAAADRGEKRADTLLYVLDNFQRAITTILICTNIVHMATASIVTLTVKDTWGEPMVPIGTIITTIVVFFAGEMLPKCLAKKYSYTLSMLTAPVLKLFMILLYPLSALLAIIGDGVRKLVSDEPEVSVTETELQNIVEDMTEEGSLNEDRGELISSAISFGDIPVEKIITHRKNLEAIDINDPIDEIMQTVKATSHSRLPVYEGSIDNIIGVLSIRTFIRAWLRARDEGRLDSLNVRELISDVYYAGSDTNIQELIPVLAARQYNIAVVRDDYDGTYGIVTMEDIIEEIVGDIFDEDDVVPPEEPVDTPEETEAQQ